MQPRESEVPYDWALQAQRGIPRLWDFLWDWESKLTWVEEADPSKSFKRRRWVRYLMPRINVGIVSASFVVALGLPALLGLVAYERHPWIVMISFIPILATFGLSIFLIGVALLLQLLAGTARGYRNGYAKGWVACKKEHEEAVRDAVSEAGRADTLNGLIRSLSEVQGRVTERISMLEYDNAFSKGSR